MKIEAVQLCTITEFAVEILLISRGGPQRVIALPSPRSDNRFAADPDALDSSGKMLQQILRISAFCDSNLRTIFPP